MSDPTPAGTVPPVDGVVNRSSPFTVQATLDRLKSSVQRHHLTLVVQIDHSDEARRVGLTMPEAHLLIFGSPQAGTPLMIASPLLALALPLKVLVWQEQAGQVWVSYESSTYLVTRFTIPTELVRNIAGIDGVVAAALQE